MKNYKKASEKAHGQTQSVPGRESEMDPKPVVIRENYKGSDKLLNKVALITGGDSGIGRSVAVHFDVMDKTFETNIFAMYYITLPVLEQMEEGDNIITTTSVTAYEGSPRFIDYSATNGAVMSFTRALAKNLAPQKIRVNGVAPGPIWTPLIPSTFDEEEVDKFGKNVPLGRPGQPCEVATSYVFLASEDASYFTGQVLHPNGGKAMQS